MDKKAKTMMLIGGIGTVVMLLLFLPGDEIGWRLEDKNSRINHPPPQHS